MADLYQPFKALGLYASKVPLYISKNKLQNEYIYSAVGNSFNVFRTNGLALIGTSDRLVDEILSITGHESKIYCGCEKNVYSFTRGKHVEKKLETKNGKNWRKVLIAGDKYLCGINDCNQLFVWTCEKGKLWRIMELDNIVGDIISLDGMNASISPILVGYQKSSMRIIDVISGNFLMELETKALFVTSMLQLPNLTTVAIGNQNGDVSIVDISKDKLLIKLHISNRGAISSMLYRDNLGEAQLLVGTEKGYLASYKLDVNGESHILWSKPDTVRDGHCLASLYAVCNNKRLLTGAGDNSLKLWTYDGVGGCIRQYGAREGHWDQVEMIKFMDSRIVSVGRDNQIRTMDVTNSVGDTSLGRIKHSRNTPISMDICLSRSGMWSSMALCLENNHAIPTWDLYKRCRGPHNMKIKEKFSPVSCVSMSQCGNFTYAGYNDGSVAKYNIQSGDHRSYHPSAHAGPVVGIVACSDGSIISCGCNDGLLIRWKNNASAVVFTQTLCEDVKKYIPGLPKVSCMSLHVDGECIAVACEGRQTNIFMFAIQTLNLIRKIPYPASIAPIKMMTFYHSSEHLIVVSRNQIRTFDFLHSKLVDCMVLQRCVKSVSMSTEDEVMAVSLEGDKGVYLWVSQYYTGCVTEMSSLPLDYVVDEDAEIDTVMPQMEADDYDDDMSGSEDENEINVDIDVDGDIMFNESSGDNSSYQTVRFSKLPVSQIGALLHMDELRKRQAETVKGIKREDDFFLPQFVETERGLKLMVDHKDMLGGINISCVEDEEEEDAPKKKKRRKLNKVNKSVEDYLGHMFLKDDEIGQDLSKLQNMTMGKIDDELKSLDPDLHHSGQMPLRRLLKGLEINFQNGRLVDLTVTIMAVCLRYYGYEIMENLIDHISNSSDDMNGDMIEINDAIEQFNESEAQQDIAANDDHQTTLNMFISLINVMRNCVEDFGSKINQIQSFYALSNSARR